jgi:hypothetical protein
MVPFCSPGAEAASVKIEAIGRDRLNNQTRKESQRSAAAQAIDDNNVGLRASNVCNVGENDRVR